jgi:hypothetical protein
MGIKTVDGYPLTAHQIERIRSLKVFFGHKSVGADLIRGLAELLESAGGPKPLIIETQDPAALDTGAGFFAHTSIGENRLPALKISEFASLVRSGFGDTADVVLMKLCYIDIDVGTGIEAVFNLYRDTIAALKREFPKTVFAHVTVPVVAVERGVKPLVKRALGRPVRGREDNLARHRYNVLLRTGLDPSDPLFDLAAAESTLPDGRSLTGTSGGLEFPVMVPRYTTDGGHLSGHGRRDVGARFAAFLASL